jgi:hypothetical protein
MRSGKAKGRSTKREPLLLSRSAAEEREHRGSAGCPEAAWFTSRPTGGVHSGGGDVGASKISSSLLRRSTRRHPLLLSRSATEEREHGGSTGCPEAARFTSRPTGGVQSGGRGVGASKMFSGLLLRRSDISALSARHNASSTAINHAAHILNTQANALELKRRVVASNQNKDNYYKRKRYKRNTTSETENGRGIYKARYTNNEAYKQN